MATPSRGLDIKLSASGVSQTTDRYRGIQYRMTHAQHAFVQVQRILEAGERRHFAGLGGKYVRTGATLASLTQPDGINAIRNAHNDELIFGSSVWYAKFLRTGKPTKAGRRKSAVLVLKQAERKETNKTLLDYFVNGPTV